MTSYPSKVGVMGLSSPCWLPTGSDMERGQLYSMEGSRAPFPLVSVTGLRRGGDVLLRLPLSMPRDCRRESNPPHPLPWSSPAKAPETLPNDEARCGRLSLLLPAARVLSIGMGTGTKGDAIFLSFVLLLRHSSSPQGSLR